MMRRWKEEMTTSPTVIKSSDGKCKPHRLLFYVVLLIILMTLIVNHYGKKLSLCVFASSLFFPKTSRALKRLKSKISSPISIRPSTSFCAPFGSGESCLNLEASVRKSHGAEHLRVDGEWKRRRLGSLLIKAALAVRKSRLRLFDFFPNKCFLLPNSGRTNRERLCVWYMCRRLLLRCTVVIGA